MGAGMRAPTVLSIPRCLMSAVNTPHSMLSPSNDGEVGANHWSPRQTYASGRFQESLLTSDRLTWAAELSANLLQQSSPRFSRDSPQFFGTPCTSTLALSGGCMPHSLRDPPANFSPLLNEPKPSTSAESQWSCQGPQRQCVASEFVGDFTMHGGRNRWLAPVPRKTRKVARKSQEPFPTGPFSIERSPPSFGASCVYSAPAIARSSASMPSLHFATGGNFNSLAQHTLVHDPFGKGSACGWITGNDEAFV